jgi:hypothetical protein
MRVLLVEIRNMAKRDPIAVKIAELNRVATTVSGVV